MSFYRELELYGGTTGSGYLKSSGLMTPGMQGRILDALRAYRPPAFAMFRGKEQERRAQTVMDHIASLNPSVTDLLYASEIGSYSIVYQQWVLAQAWRTYIADERKQAERRGDFDALNLMELWASARFFPNDYLGSQILNLLREEKHPVEIPSGGMLAESQAQELASRVLQSWEDWDKGWITDSAFYYEMCRGPGRRNTGAQSSEEKRECVSIFVGNTKRGFCGWHRTIRKHTLFNEAWGWGNPREVENLDETEIGEVFRISQWRHA